MNYIFKMIKMLENNFNQIKATGTFIRWMLFLFSTKKGQEITENLFYQKLSFVGLLVYLCIFLSLE